jgi:hypothetical protein
MSDERTLKSFLDALFLVKKIKSFFLKETMTFFNSLELNKHGFLYSNCKEYPHGFEQGLIRLG